MIIYIYIEPIAALNSYLNGSQILDWMDYCRINRKPGTTITLLACLNHSSCCTLESSWSSALKSLLPLVFMTKTIDFSKVLLFLFQPLYFRNLWIVLIASPCPLICYYFHANQITLFEPAKQDYFFVQIVEHYWEVLRKEWYLQNHAFI